MRTLVLEHDPSCPLGRLEPLFDARGISTEVVAPEGMRALGDPGRYDLVILLGSDESAYDDSVGWVADEFAYARRAIDSGVPILGICFGAQMLARALGGQVRRAAVPEVAWKSLTLAEGADWIPAGPWLTWHADTFDWPPGATPLAWTDMAPQVFASGAHLGIQFHPEATADLIERWLDVDRRTLALRDVDQDALIAETRRREGQADRAAALLFERHLDRLVE